MVLIEAIRLFNLSDSYTAEDVTKSYRKLMMKWHPDVNKSKDAEEKSKQINEAKEILLKALKSPRNNSYSRGTYSNYKKQPVTNPFVVLLKKRIGNYVNINLNPYLSRTIDKINKLITRFEINSSSSYIDFQARNYQIINKIIDKLFVEYAVWFCNHYMLNINVHDDYIEINSKIIKYKEMTLIQFASKIEEDNFKNICAMYNKRLLNKIGFDKSHIIFNGNNKNVNSAFVRAYGNILDKITEFKNLKLNTIKELDIAYSGCMLFIEMETKNFIKNYCALHGLVLDYHDNNYYVNGKQVNLNGTIVDIYLALEQISFYNRHESAIRNNNKYFNITDKIDYKNLILKKNK